MMFNIVYFKMFFKNNLSVEEKINKTIDVWNSANIQLAFEEDDYEETFKDLYGGDDDFELLKKMIKVKLSKYSTLTHFIENSKVIEKGDRIILEFTTKDPESYLLNMMEGMSDSFDASEENEENYINRNAIVLSLKDPFFNWLNKIFPGEDHSEDIKESNIYLINDTDNIFEVEKWLKKKYKIIFEKELEGWTFDEKTWPKKRTYKMFREWFSVSLSTSVYDLENSPVSKSYDL